MAYLKDVKVKKVSFVKRAANQRKFLLLKSDDSNNKEEENYKPMRKEVNEFLIKLLKSDKVVSKPVEGIIEILKGDKDLNLSDEEIQEAKDFVTFSREVMPEIEKKSKDSDDDKKDDVKKSKSNDDNGDSTIVSISKEEYTKMQDTMNSLSDTIQKMNRNTERRDLISWLEKECPFLPSPVGETAEIILKMQEADAKSAEAYKTQLKTASAMLAQSATLREIGTSTDDLIKAEGTELELISKFSKDVDEVRKSSDGANGHISPDKLANIIRSYGSRAFEQYRNAHADRAARRGR